MPKRWERALSDVPRLEEPETLWLESTVRADRGGLPDPTTPRRQRLVAAIVAVGVFLAAAAFSWQVFEDARTRVPVDDAVPTTTAPAPPPSFASLTLARSPADSGSSVPTATLEFGDFSSWVKTSGTNFVHPFVTTSELPFTPMGFPAGLPLRLEGDALGATLEIYDSYPLDREPIATYDLTEGPAFLPGDPGGYFLVVRGEWSDGWASYLSGITVLRPGTLQFVLEDNRREGDATAELWVDGKRLVGAVVRRSQAEGDVGVESAQPPIQFAPEEYLSIEAGAPVVVRGDPTELSAALTGPEWADASGSGTSFLLYGPEARIPAAPGRHLLVLDAAWQEGQLGWAGNGYREEVRFAFPVDVGADSVPSPAPLPSGSIIVTFDTSEAGKIPQASATFGERDYPAVMNRYRFTIDGEVFESSHQYRDAESVAAATIRVPSGAAIEFEGDQDRVLVGWGDGELATGGSVSVQGSPKDTVVLRFRGEWGADSFVEWELFLDIQGG